MRSQFAANQKAALGSDATATLMGHSSPDSPSTGQDGKANQAHANFKGLRENQYDRPINPRSREAGAR
jgi:hypothetical protein